MRTLTDRTFEIFRRTDGTKFNGSLTAPNTYISTSKFPKRILHVQVPCVIKIGDVIKTPSGDRVLLLEFVSMIGGCKSFVAAHVNASYTWSRPIMQVNEVSRQQELVGYLPMGVIQTSQDQLEDLVVEDMHVDQFGFYVGQDVKVGDKINGRKVTNVRAALGVKYVTTK